MYAMQRPTTLLLALSPLLTLAHASPVNGIEPAATTVPNAPAAGAPLQAAETLQLTDEVIEHLGTEEATSDYAKYFKFGDGDVPAHSASCKTFPGDDAWPKDTTWDMFDVLLGGALIPTKPIAASCYDTRWGKKDAAACSNVTNNFTSPLFHSADPTSSKLSPLTDFGAQINGDLQICGQSIRAGHVCLATIPPAKHALWAHTQSTRSMSQTWHRSSLQSTSRVPRTCVLSSRTRATAILESRQALEH